MNKLLRDKVFAGLVVVFLLGAIGGIFVAREIDFYRKRQDARYDFLRAEIDLRESELGDVSRELSFLEQELDILKGEVSDETAALLAAFEEERGRQLAREVEQSTEVLVAQRKLSELEGKLDLTEASSLKQIVEDWRSGVVRMRCVWVYGEGVEGQFTGSGVFVSWFGEDDLRVVTSRHLVVDDNGYLPANCDVAFPDLGDEYRVYAADGAFLAGDGSSDFATVRLGEVSDSVRAVAMGVGEYCGAVPVLGDDIVILGYPSIGSESDVTVTEGIVSGYDGDYYITSAKVEQGNSGGAAVLLGGNCYLGVPTFVQTGSIESLARILDVNTLFRIY